MAKAASAATRSVVQTLRRFLKKPWEITGPCADPEYRLAVPLATEYRLECPATTKQKAIVPTSNPETVFDIKSRRMKIPSVEAISNRLGM
ncbi:hypothetical protein LWI28_014983 [Acer negundo]|uniref:Uncharacterized protein n=1 Tax=Acer negundo TaxID=4023 RepID=A0AAD5IQ95_ACENE|nr:hypothetical protein LWI28_014983 [Acer negundo]KAK4843970.1 hypothetical protein QYF36_014886 [Acer negundo]